MPDERPMRFWTKLKSENYAGSRRTSNYTLSKIADAWATTWLIYGPVGKEESEVALRIRFLADVRSVLSRTEHGEVYDETHYLSLFRKNLPFLETVVVATLNLPSLLLSIQSNPARKELADRVLREVEVSSFGSFLDAYINRLRIK